jgi:hypothetical protein
MVDLVGVGQFEVEETDLLVLEERAGMPAAAVQLDRHVAGNLEGFDVVQRRLSLQIVEPVGRRDRDEPGLAANRGEALGHLTVARDLLEAQPPARQAHDVEARSSTRQLELRVVGAEHHAIFDRRDDLAERSERLGREAVRRNRADSRIGFGCLHRVLLSSIQSAAARACGKSKSLFVVGHEIGHERTLLLQHGRAREPAQEARHRIFVAAHRGRIRAHRHDGGEVEGGDPPQRSFVAAGPRAELVVGAEIRERRVGLLRSWREHAAPAENLVAEQSELWRKMAEFEPYHITDDVFREAEKRTPRKAGRKRSRPEPKPPTETE